MIFNKFDQEKLIKWFKESKNQLMIYHRDADGVCSAVLLLKFFSEFRHIPREGPLLDKKFIRLLESRRPDLLVFLDIPIDQEWKKIDKLLENLPETKLVVIDHHIPEKNMNSQRIIHINPRLRKGGEKSYIPTSCILYELFRELGYNVEPYMWISVIGIIGDYARKDCEWFLARYKEIRGQENFKKDILRLTNACDMISSAITLKGLEGAEKSLAMLLSSESYEDFEKSRQFKKWNNLVKTEIKKILRDFEKNKEEFPTKNLIFYKIKSKLNITSIISTILAEKYPDKIIIVRKKSPNGWKISLRYQKGDVNIGSLAKKASEGIGSGGGHPKSAGAMVSEWHVFKERVLSWI
ncbi:MAG: DHH family phosphoesterase [Candidatus Aenigmarchaeota archaeon]|nr:DHH family phosphoesterase [Candidatus Aenigmarchaeota archaeon]